MSEKVNSQRLQTVLFHLCEIFEVMVFQKMEKWSGCQGLKMVGGVGSRREVDVLIKGHRKDPCGNVQYLPCGGGHVSLYTRACTFT